MGLETPACSLACSLRCSLACSLASLLARLLAFYLACLSACLLRACFIACLLACCLLAFLLASSFFLFYATPNPPTPPLSACGNSAANPFLHKSQFLPIHIFSQSLILGFDRHYQILRFSDSTYSQILGFSENLFLHRVL